MVGHLGMNTPSLLPDGFDPTGLDGSNIDGTISSILSNALSIAYTVVGILAVVFIIIGGIQLATSAGNPSGTKKAKTTISYAIGGLVLALMAGAIQAFILGF